MIQVTFHPWWLDTCLYTFKEIEIALRSKLPFERHRRTLTYKRDDLHDVCVRFENDGEAENDEATYLVLFDALTFITDALRLPVIERKQLTQAAALLRELYHRSQP